MLSIHYQELGAGYGDNIRFEISNNTLYSKVALGVGPNLGVGEFIIRYRYKNEIFQVERIDFVAASEYIN
ncbi:MAG: hypothetical protein ACI8WT_001088 [Clostridium sp.]|jgi:hypothetical protein